MSWKKNTKQKKDSKTDLKKLKNITITTTTNITLRHNHKQVILPIISYTEDTIWQLLRLHLQERPTSLASLAKKLNDTKAYISCLSGIITKWYYMINMKDGINISTVVTKEELTNVNKKINK